MHRLSQLLAVALIALTLNAAPSHAQSSTGSEPYQELTIDHLRARTYGQGQFKVEQTLQVTDAFTRSLISFTSDGLTVYGFMNTPKGGGPFPVVLVLHGYVNPRAYRTPYTYTQRYADALARAGFLVIHPDYRGHGRSDAGAPEDNLFRVGYAVDVLNLIEYAKALPDVRPDAIGLFGHSMGGGISIRVATVSDDVKAAVLYGAMSGDEQDNVRQITTVYRPGARIPEQDVPPEVWGEISPVNALANIQAGVEIHHGVRDTQVPVAWSEVLAGRLSALGKEAQLFTYPRAGHSLQGRDYATMMERVVAFFKARL